jgi:hypothetical protein
MCPAKPEPDKETVRTVFDRLVVELGLAEVIKRIRTVQPKPRGRSKIDDTELLAKMALLLRADKTLKPTQAARRVLGDGSDSQERRLVRKFKFCLNLNITQGANTLAAAGAVAVRGTPAKATDGVRVTGPDEREF